MLTDNEISTIKGYRKTYADFGLKPNLHVDIPMPPYAPNDQQQATATDLSPNIPVSKFDFKHFIKKSGTVILLINTPTGLTTTITMKLTLNFPGLTLAIPRWSIYNPDDSSPSNEILASFDGVDVAGSKNVLHLNAQQSWEAIQGTNDIRHILTIAISNNSGFAIPFTFKGDWLYMGDQV